MHLISCNLGHKQIIVGIKLILVMSLSLVSILSNRINLFKLKNVRILVALSPESEAHVLNARAFRIELEFRTVGF